MTSNPYWPLATPDSLGPISGADDVRDAVRDTIDTWSPYYLAILSKRLVEAGRILPGRKTLLPNFGVWRNDLHYRPTGTGQPAAFRSTVVASVGKPDLQGTGLYRATWRAQIYVQVYGTDREEAADLVGWYEKATRWAVLQHRSLGKVAAATNWTGSEFSLLGHTGTRTLCQAVIGLDVTMNNVLDTTRGPKTVPKLPTPPVTDETVEEVILDLTKVPVNEPI